MTTDIPRYLIRSQGRGTDFRALEEGFSLAAKTCRDLGLTQVTMVIPSKGDFPRTDVAKAKFLGEPRSRVLSRGQSIGLSGGVQMGLESPKTIREHGAYEVLLAIHLSGRDMDLVDAIRQAKAVIWIPWLQEEAADWLSRWAPKVLGGDQGQPFPVQLDPVIAEELQRLTSSINLTTGLGHPSDKQRAEEMFRRLRAQGKQVIPSDLKNWAIRNGWPPKDADSLAKLASRELS